MSLLRPKPRAVRLLLNHCKLSPELLYGMHVDVPIRRPLDVCSLVGIWGRPNLDPRLLSVHLARRARYRAVHVCLDAGPVSMGLQWL